MSRSDIVDSQPIRAFKAKMSVQFLVTFLSAFAIPYLSAFKSVSSVFALPLALSHFDAPLRLGEESFLTFGFSLGLETNVVYRLI